MKKFFFPIPIIFLFSLILTSCPPPASPEPDPPQRMTILELDNTNIMPSNVLYTKIKTDADLNGHTYVDQVVTLIVRDELGIDLKGIEKLENLQTLHLINLNLIDLNDVQPVLDLLIFNNLTDLRLIDNPNLNVDAQNALEAEYPGCIS